MDPSELLKDIKGLRPDLVFLDIEMPEMNGLELAARLLELQEDIEVVFVTAYREYALEAFGVNALDYLLKPVVPDLLHRTIDRVLKRRTGTAPQKRQQLLPGLYVSEALKYTKRIMRNPFASLLQRRKSYLPICWYTGICIFPNGRCATVCGRKFTRRRKAIIICIRQCTG